TYTYNTGEWVFLIGIIEVPLCIINIILGIINLIMKKQYKKNNLLVDTSQKWITIKSILLITLISLMIVLGQYIPKNIEKNKIEKEIKEVTMTYLKNKYNNDNFKIEYIDRHFSANGFISTNHLESYRIKAYYIPDNIKFYIDVEVNDSREILKNTYEDRLIYAYYKRHFKEEDFIVDGNIEKEKINKYLKEEQFNVELSLSDSYTFSAIDALTNKIPSKKELYDLIIDYHMKHKLYIKIAENEIKGENIKLELKEYLIKISKNIIEYYDELDDYEVTCNYDRGRKDKFIGVIKINKEYINIEINGNIVEKIKR
ncbi:MAG: hypothetical protein HFE04_03015, partial [Bacilli bacterium]|nr:hypothetical protein [Bacilli bacterium]